MASKFQTSKRARAYASAEGPMSPLLASPMIIVFGALHFIKCIVLSRIRNPSIPKAS